MTIWLLLRRSEAPALFCPVLGGWRLMTRRTLVPMRRHSRASAVSPNRAGVDSAQEFGRVDMLDARGDRSSTAS